MDEKYFIFADGGQLNLCDYFVVFTNISPSNRFTLFWPNNLFVYHKFWSHIAHGYVQIWHRVRFNFSQKRIRKCQSIIFPQKTTDHW